MPDSLASVVVDIGGNATGLTKTIATVKALLEGDLSGALQGAIEVAKEAAETIEEAFSKIGEQIGESVKAAATHEDAMVSLAQALAGAGVQGAGAAAQAFDRFALKLEETTRLSRDQIDSAAKIGASFGLTGDKLQEATKAAADLSARFGIDLSASMMKVAQGMETGRISFGRMSLQIADAHMKGASFEQVMQAIESRVGGAATAATDTYNGHLDQMGKAWDNLHVKVGTAITDSQAVKGFMDAITETVKAISGAIKINATDLDNWVRKNWRDLSNVITAVIGVTEDFIVGLSVLGEYGADQVDALLLVVDKLEPGFEAAMAPITGLGDLLVDLGVTKTNPVRDAIETMKSGLHLSEEAAKGVGAGFDSLGTIAQKAAAAATHGLNAVINRLHDTKAAASDVAPSNAPPEEPTPHSDGKAEMEAKLQAVREYFTQMRAEVAATDAEYKALGQSIGTALGALATHSMSTHQIIKQVFQEELKAVEQYVIKRITAEQTAAIAKMQADDEASIHGQAVASAEAVTRINANAATAASGAAASQASIPGIGPELAIAAAATIFSLVEAYATKFSEGGFVGGMGTRDTVPAMLTPGEIVLPNKRGSQIDGDLRAAAMERLGGGRPTIQHNVSLSMGLVNLPNRSEARRWIRDTFLPEFRAVEALARR